MSWYRELDGRQRTTFWACFGGWAVDALDVQIYALVIPALMAAWTLTKAQAGFAATAALLFSSLGGIIAGRLADRIGRVRVLQICVVWFSVCTFLSGLTRTYDQLLIARSLQGLGFGGEWAAGAVLIAEVVPTRFRGKIVAAVSSGWSIGYGAAAILFMVLFQVLGRDQAWRAMFFVGALPAVVLLLMLRKVPESDLYLASRSRPQAQQAQRWTSLLRGRLGLNTLVAWLICLGVLGGNYTVLAWLPTYLQSERGLSYSNTGLFLLVNIVGSFIGYNLGGYVSDWLGRRNALKLFAVLGALSVFAYLGFGATSLAILLLGFPLGFAQSAMNSGVAPLLSELFPTELRATGQGFCYNAGRGVGAFFPALVGMASAKAGLAAAISLAACAAYALVLLCSFVLPETRDRSLSSIDLAGNAG